MKDNMPVGFRNYRFTHVPITLATHRRNQGAALTINLNP